MSDYPYIAAKSISYGGERAYSAVKYIVIHYTGNNNDTAKNNCDFFHNGNTRSAGAHFFVSQNGDVYQSIQMKKVAYAVGGFVTQKNGAGSLYKVCTNSNSVSIELCDNASRDPSAAQTEAVRQLVAYIRSVCPNAGTIIRHWDVSGKSCPARMTGSNNAKWLTFRNSISAEAPAPKKEEPEMTIDEIKKEILKDKEFCAKLVDEYRQHLQDNDAAKWSADARSWATNNGLIQGGSGSYMWEDFLTREQAAAMLQRYDRLNADDGK